MKKGFILECKEQYTYVLLPNGKLKKIKRQYNHEIGKEIQMPLYSLPKIMTLAMMSCCLVLAFLLSPLNQTKTIEALSYVSLSVNPGLVFKIDENQKIVAVSYTNKDGQNLTSQIDFINKKLDDSVKLFIDYCFENHYFDNNQKIDINVVSENQGQIQQLEKQIKDMISSYLAQHQVTISVRVDQVADTQKQEAAQLGIPDSKMKLIDLVLSYYPQFSKEELAKKSVDDLIDYLEEVNYDENMLDKLEDKLEEDDDQEDEDDDDEDDD